MYFRLIILLLIMSMIALLFVFVFASSSKISDDARACENRGGTLIRAAVRYECVKLERVK